MLNLCYLTNKIIKKTKPKHLPRHRNLNNIDQETRPKLQGSLIWAT